MQVLKFKHTILVCLSAIALLGAGCSQSSLQQSYQDAYGNREAAAAAKPGRTSVSLRISRTTTSLTAKFSCTGTTLAQGTLFYTDGTSVSKTLSGTYGTISTSKVNGLWYARLKTGSGDYWYFDKSGDYWYFDRSGIWKPSSTTATSKSGSCYKGNGNGAKKGGWNGNDDWNSDWDGNWNSGNGNDDDRIVSTAVTGTDGTQLSVTLRDKLLIVDGNVDLVSVEAEFEGAAGKDYDLSGNRSTVNLKKLADDLDSFVVTDANGITWEFDGSGQYND
jgi:hypothetical protein